MAKSMKGGDQELVMGIISFIIFLAAAGISIYLWVRNEKRQQRIENAVRERS